MATLLGLGLVGLVAWGASGLFRRRGSAAPAPDPALSGSAIASSAVLSSQASAAGMAQSSPGTAQTGMVQATAQSDAGGGYPLL